MFINNEIDELVQKKYDEAVATAADSIFLEDNTLGNLTLFLKEKPTHVLLTYTFDGKEVYVGGNQDVTKASS
jgi:hypothetical protein